MDFEWDEHKRQAVLLERGVDFARAALIFDDPGVKKILDLRCDYGEPRWRAIGQVGDETLIVIYTSRGDVIRLITAWSLGRNAKARY